MEGHVTKRMKIRLCYNNQVYEVETLGTLTPKPVALDELEAGDVGFVVANIKDVADARMGDTVVEAERPAPALPGFEAIKPMVFAGLFPVLADEYEPLRDALYELIRLCARVERYCTTAIDHPDDPVDWFDQDQIANQLEELAHKLEGQMHTFPAALPRTGSRSSSSRGRGSCRSPAGGSPRPEAIRTSSPSAASSAAARRTSSTSATR